MTFDFHWFSLIYIDIIDFYWKLLDVAKVGWQDPLGDGQTVLFRFKLWLRYRVLPSSWNRKTLLLFYFKRTVVIPLDYTGNRNFHRHSNAVVFATPFNQRLSKCLPVFLLLHNQLLIIKSNQWKSITFRCIGDWLSIFIDWLSQKILIDFYWFLLIYILIEVHDWFSLIVVVWWISNLFYANCYWINAAQKVLRSNRLV